MSPLPGDRSQRFATVYKESYGAIHAYASRRVGAEGADEVAAETFLVAWRRFDALPSEPLPWLYGVARNVVLRQHAATGRQRLTRAALANEQTWPRPDGSEVDDPRLWEAWAQVSLADREVLALVAWEGLPVADAARAIGCSAAVFSVRLHRARRRFARLLTTAGPVVRTELSEV